MDKYPIGASINLDELSRDPFPIYARLREMEPISYVPALEMYFLTGYGDVRDVLQDNKHFIVGTERSLSYDIFGSHMMTVEGDDHTRYKSAHQKFFLPPAIRATLEDQIAPHVDSLIDGFAQDGEVDLRKSFASRLPVLTMLSLFGLDLDEEPHLRTWYNNFEKALSNFTWDESVRAHGKASADAFHQLIQGYLDGIRAGEIEASGSLLEALLDAPEESRLSDDEIRHNALIVFFGGISTVEALVLNTLYALSSFPDQLMRVQQDVGLISKVLHEVIRWQGPVQSATRHVSQDCEIRGHVLRAGQTVNCMLGGANRDPDIFEDPDRFDIDRPNARRHLGFAVGPHHCLGSHLARAEARIALENLFTRLPGLSLDLARTTPPEGYEFRQPHTAVAVWE